MIYLVNHRNPIPLTREEDQLFGLCRDLCMYIDSTNVNVFSDFLGRRRSPRHFDINVRNADDETVLSICLGQIRVVGDRERIVEIERLKSYVISVLIENGANVHVRVPDIFGRMSSMLHFACKSYNSTQIIEILLSSGSNVNDLNELNQTPLHFASRLANLEMMLFLLNSYANPSARDQNGNTPMTFLMNNFGHQLYNVKCESQLIRFDNCLDLLLRNGGNINDVGESGASSLFLVINGLGLGLHIKIPFIRKLLNLGADVNVGFNKLNGYFRGNVNGENVVYVSGDTPLHAAASLGDIQVVKLLLLYNPDINRGNSLKQTALDYASKEKYDVYNEIKFHARQNLFNYITQG